MSITTDRVVDALGMPSEEGGDGRVDVENVHVQPQARNSSDIDAIEMH